MWENSIQNSIKISMILKKLSINFLFIQLEIVFLLFPHNLFDPLSFFKEMQPYETTSCVFQFRLSSSELI
jgi:hypothetical protein